MSFDMEDNKTEVKQKNEYFVPLSDKRTKLIYERYQAGRSITIDDLKYLTSNNPEDYLVQSIVESDKEQKTDLMTTKINNIIFVKKLHSQMQTQENPLEKKEIIEVPKENHNPIQEAIALVKLILDTEGKDEIDLLNIHNETAKLSALIKKMNYWGESFTDQMTKYTYKPEKEFNVLA